jgi:hypothetical protein
MFDYAIELRDRARKDWEHSTARFKAAVVARNQQHPADTNNRIPRPSLRRQQ